MRLKDIDRVFDSSARVSRSRREILSFTGKISEVLYKMTLHVKRVW